MSTVIESIDLTQFGCPLHYIKAREAIRILAPDSALLLVVNKGKALNEILKSLRKDGHVCEIEDEQPLTITIRMTKKL